MQLTWSLAVYWSIGAGNPASDNDATCHETLNDEGMATLFEWAKHHGAKGLENVGVGIVDKGGRKVRGLVAAKAVYVSENRKLTMVSIPIKIILHIQHPSILHSAFRNVSNVNDRMALFLASEKRLGEQSFWAPMIQQLPSHEDYARFHPFYTKEALLDNLIKLPAAFEVRRMQSRVQKAWDDYRKDISGEKFLEFTDFKWAITTLMTRSYSFGEGKAMVPIVDIGNCCLDRNTKWTRNVTGRFFKLKAMRSIKAGEELTESYRLNESNAEYFKSYGFVLQGNPTPLLLLDNQTCKSLEHALLFNQDSSLLVTESLRELGREHCRFHEPFKSWAESAHAAENARQVAWQQLKEGKA